MFSIKILVFVILIAHQAFGAPKSVHNVSTRTSEESDLVADYYWREYNGIIPSDAIPGGFDKAGSQTYIGQIYNKAAGLLPATIYPDSKTAISTAGTSEDFIKILCSRHHERYQWTLTKTEDTHLLTNCHLVVGGVQDTGILYIARVKHELETVVGKVVPHHIPNYGLYIYYKGKQIKYLSYEILTYNCSISQYYSYSNITIVGVN